MKFALVGTGQMGQAVESVAGERGHEIVARFNRSNPLLEAPDVSAFNGADVAIDFSLPAVAADHIEHYCRWKQPAVIGTTGWYDELDRVREKVAERDASILYAANFSVGVALLVRALRAIAPLAEQLPEYDVFIHEVHHTRKVDSPSGTAVMLGNELVNALSRKSHIESETRHDRIEPGALHVTSTRAGSVFGKHTVGFDSPFDELAFTHVAKNRLGFAFGAVKAAEWLPGHKGLLTLDDVLG